MGTRPMRSEACPTVKAIDRPLHEPKAQVNGMPIALPLLHALRNMQQTSGALAGYSAI